jgi:hypothetical protein
MNGQAKRLTRRAALAALTAIAICSLPNHGAIAQADALPSWSDGLVKRAITDFVARVTAQGGPDFVPPAERIAVFDNDGTLWGEQPMYFQFTFGLERVKALAPQHPEWKDRQPFKAVIEGDTPCVAGGNARF